MSSSSRRSARSCNRAIYGALPNTAGYPLALRMVLRSNVAPLYRSDVTWLERLHGDTPTDLRPEDLARARQGALFAAVTVTNSLAFPTVEPALAARSPRL